MKEMETTRIKKGGGGMNKDVPIWERYTLTIREVARYFHIGEPKMRQIVELNKDADFIVMNGNRAMIKRKTFEQYIDRCKTL